MNPTHSQHTIHSQHRSGVFVDALEHVFEIMLQVKCAVSEEAPLKDGENSSELIHSTVEFESTNSNGKVGVNMSRETARKAVQCMTGMDTEEEEILLDIVGEIANMVGGYGIHNISEYSYQLGLPSTRVLPDKQLLNSSEAGHSIPVKTEIGPIELNMKFDE